MGSYCWMYWVFKYGLTTFAIALDRVRRDELWWTQHVGTYVIPPSWGAKIIIRLLYLPPVCFFSRIVGGLASVEERQSRLVTCTVPESVINPRKWNHTLGIVIVRVFCDYQNVARRFLQTLKSPPSKNRTTDYWKWSRLSGKLTYGTDVSVGFYLKQD
jgi:hypothetical protein